MKLKKINNWTEKRPPKFFENHFANFSLDFGLSRGKILLWLLYRVIGLYFVAGRGGGRGWRGESGGGVVRTCWLFNGHRTTEITGPMTVFIGSPRARKLY